MHQPVLKNPCCLIYGYFSRKTVNCTPINCDLVDLVSSQSLSEKWEVSELIQLVENISFYLTTLLYMKCGTLLSLLL